MKAVCVTQFICWARRTNYCLSDLTLHSFFRSCYYWHTGEPRSEADLQFELAEFAKGVVPFYVVLCMHKHLYPDIVSVNKFPQPKILV